MLSTDGASCPATGAASDEGQCPAMSPGSSSSVSLPSTTGTSPDENSDDEKPAGAPLPLRPIPGPKAMYVIGNLPDIDPVHPLESFIHLAKIYGDIYRLDLMSVATLCSSFEIVDKLCDETRFQKHIGPPLQQVRNFAGDGLFTAFHQEHNWTIAHRVLVPAFGPVAIKKMQPMMLDMITQMLMSWEHHSPQPFEAADQFTRLTFDTIGWCAFRFRFNSFHTKDMHPFIKTMSFLLTESGLRARFPAFVNSLMWSRDAHYHEEIKNLHALCDEIVAHRRQHPDPNAKDLLNNMILDKDTKTGESLSDENIRFQMVTFLIAGHETTSGTLSFAMYYILKNPEHWHKVRAEADAAVAAAGGNLLKINPSSLVYTDAVLKETLRLQPPVPLFSLTPSAEEGEILPGGYHVKKGNPVMALLHTLHRDPRVWGSDAEEFRPDRWLPPNDPPPANAWKPFGNGARACIGRGFAMQEALLALCLISSRFDVEFADPSYDLRIYQTLTIKPEAFNIIARPRKDRNQSLLSELINGGTSVVHAGTASGAAAGPNGAVPAGDGGKLYVMYGSNSGSCEGLAQDIARDGAARGFAVDLGELDSKAGGGVLPTDGPVVIVTASYEGKPTDNARSFVAALEAAEDAKKPLEGVKYIVMGAGHHDWAATFHRVPKLIDRRIADLGGDRLMDLSLADAGGDIVGDFEDFQQRLWEKLGAGGSGAAGVKTEATDTAPPVQVLPSTANPAGERVQAGIKGVGQVLSTSVLTHASDITPQTNCITVQLPAGQAYRAGDYLAVLPKNPAPVIDRALAHFGLQGEDNVVLNVGANHLPSGVPLRAADLLGSYVEIGQPVSRRVIPQVAALAKDATQRAAIEALADGYVARVVEKRLSLLDLLETYDSIDAGLDFFVLNVPRMKIRQYSISSSPLADPTKVSLTFVVHTAACPDHTQRALGVASNYLAFLSPGDKLYCAVKSSAGFHLPTDPSVPVVLFAAGSGLAPFRGFIEERALQRAAGREVGETVLFFGCRNEDELLHADELAQWTKTGALDFRPVLSRSEQTSVPALFEGTNVSLKPEEQYVQHRVWSERADVRRLYEAGAQFYMCGSGAKLGMDLRRTLTEVIREVLAEKNGGEATWEEAEEVALRLSAERYRTDVFL